MDANVHGCLGGVQITAGRTLARFPHRAVIGQPNMTTGMDTPGVAANKLWYPVGVVTC